MRFSPKNAAGLPRLTIVSPSACVSATDFGQRLPRSSLVATSSAAGALGAPVPDKTAQLGPLFGRQRQRAFIEPKVHKEAQELRFRNETPIFYCSLHLAS